MDDFLQSRSQMVEKSIRSRGIADPRVLRAMNSVPRHLFVAPSYRARAYEDRPLPIGAGQTISQPYIVALMAELLQLKPQDKVLEIGAGSGYAAAVLAELAREVYAVERIEELADLAQQNLAAAGYEHVQLRCADGSSGWPEAAPFDAILVSAGATGTPKQLLDQLKPGGRLVIPVGPGGYEGQELLRMTRTAEGDFETGRFGLVRFVPLISGTTGNPPAHSKEP